VSEIPHKIATTTPCVSKTKTFINIIFLKYYIMIYNQKVII
jgi:hypothetical protein